MIAYFYSISSIKHKIYIGGGGVPQGAGVVCSANPRPRGRPRRRGPEAPLRPGATAPPVTAAAGVPRTNVSAALPLSNQKIAVVHIHFT